MLHKKKGTDNYIFSPGEGKRGYLKINLYIFIKNVTYA